MSAFPHADPIPRLPDKRVHPFVPFDIPVAAASAAGLPPIGRHKASRSLLHLAFMLFLACVLAIQVAAPSRAEDRPSCTDRCAAFIAEVASRLGIPAHMIRNVMHVESAGDSRAVSHAGTMGLMQIMPATRRSCARVTV